MRRTHVPLALCLILLVFSLSFGQNLEDRVVEHILTNGMTFLFVERHQAPVFAGRIYVKVGGVDEHVGITGLAHLLEHMAFKGTRHIGTRNYAEEKKILDRIDRVAEALIQKRQSFSEEELDHFVELERQVRVEIQKAHTDKQIAEADLSALVIQTLEKKGQEQEDPSLTSYVEFKKLEQELKRLQEEHKQYVVKEEFHKILQTEGGVGINAGTAKDYTVYEISLPSNRFELWALMESDRMRDPVLREFYEERDVVAEERRLRTDNKPDGWGGKLYELLVTTAFAAHPYGTPVIGWMSDIQSLTRKQLEDFHNLYYVPGNAVAAVVGDINVEEAIPIVEKYFGPLPAGPPPPDVHTAEPKQMGERRVELEYDAEPRVMIAYHKPTLPAFDDYVFDVIDYLLYSSGRSARLYKRLIKKDRIASSIKLYSTPGSRFPNLLFMEVVPIHPHTTEEVEAAIYDEIERLKTEPVSEHELQKVKNQLLANFIRGLSSNEGLAEQLAYFQLIAGDWRYIVTHRQVVDQITPEDIMRVARTYLTRQNRTVATLIKKATAKSDSGI